MSILKNIYENLVYALLAVIVFAASSWLFDGTPPDHELAWFVIFWLLFVTIDLVVAGTKKIRGK